MPRSKGTTIVSVLGHSGAGKGLGVGEVINPIRGGRNREAPQMIIANVINKELTIPTCIRLLMRGFL